MGVPMSFPFPLMTMSGSAGEKGTRDKLRDYVEKNGVAIRSREDQTIEVDELLDAALGPEQEVSRAVPIIGIGLLVLLITWIVIILVVFPR